MALHLSKRLAGRNLTSLSAKQIVASTSTHNVLLHGLLREHQSDVTVSRTMMATRSFTFHSHQFPSLQAVVNKRFFSSPGGGGGGGYQASPSYQIYGEEVAFTLKCIMPSFRLVGNRTVVVDKTNKGRLLLEFTPRQAQDTNRFAWDQSIKFALLAEEVGTLVACLSHGQPVELARQTAALGGQQQQQQQQGQYGFHGETPGVGSLQKILRAMPDNGGAATFSIDYELDGRGSQDPPNPNEVHGPLQIRLMAGEFQVLKSIMEHSIPRLVGWAQMMDRSAEDLVSAAGNNSMPSQ
ncbi:unnamed protein product [Cylindrotheca closterium]|uniref:Uncharacterized protein n=1 Tax=Cylindrotheca closterium TaxID=2856 RepID=A0AAD2FII6_9STRA|nr:unnamed protein product [Cylindrotheca closterium]